MIAISITAEAYRATRATLPKITDDAAPRLDERGLIRIWLAREFVNRLGRERGPGESYSDVILRLAKEGSPLRAGRPP